MGCNRQRLRPYLQRGTTAAAEATGNTMKFMLTFAIKPEAKGRDDAIHRFMQTGGQPPQGVKLLGRWTRADFGGGFDLLESDSVEALTEFSLMWSDLMELRLVPVIEDAELGQVLGANREVAKVGGAGTARGGR
jgi:Protein of unknown function (DUF3303)